MISEGPSHISMCLGVPNIIDMHMYIIYIIIHNVHARTHAHTDRVVWTLSDLWGGVNGHGVNLRDKCGV